MLVGRCSSELSGVRLTWLGYPTGVQFIVKLPDELARQVIPVGSDPARIAVEDMAVEAYRARRPTEHQLSTLRNNCATR
jgi:hypothetical protein